MSRADTEPNSWPDSEAAAAPEALAVELAGDALGLGLELEVARFELHLHAFEFGALSLVARSALPCGSRKLRAKPSFTRTTSPIWPSLPTRSSRMTSMLVSPLLFRISGGWSGRRRLRGDTRAQRHHGFEQAEERQQHDRPAEQADGEVETGEHEAAAVDTERDGMQHRQAEQRESEQQARSEYAARKTDEIGQERAGNRDRQHSRGERRKSHLRDLRPGPLEPARDAHDRPASQRLNRLVAVSAAAFIGGTIAQGYRAVARDPLRSEAAAGNSPASRTGIASARSNSRRSPACTCAASKP